jgi:hypothetical protein
MFRLVDHMPGRGYLQDPIQAERTAGDILDKPLKRIAVRGGDEYALVDAEPRMLPGTHLFDSLTGNQPLVEEQLENLVLPREWRCHNVAHARVSETARQRESAGSEKAALKTQSSCLSPKRDIATYTEIEVDFSESDPPVVLGALDFLRNFKLTVDYPNEQLILEW